MELLEQGEGGHSVASSGSGVPRPIPPYGFDHDRDRTTHNLVHSGGHVSAATAPSPPPALWTLRHNLIMH